MKYDAYFIYISRIVQYSLTVTTFRCFSYDINFSGNLDTFLKITNLSLCNNKFIVEIT